MRLAPLPSLIAAALLVAACSRVPGEAAEAARADAPEAAVEATGAAEAVEAPAPVASAAAEPTAPVPAAIPASADPAASDGTAVPVSLPRVTVHKSPSCGCCTAWVEHLQTAGFQVDVVATDDLETVRKAMGVPAGKASCHTAVVDGYFVEGHVPAADVARLLRERPAAKGLTVPGMPIGSPGMEIPSGFVQPYSVLLVGDGGSTREFSRYGE